MNDCPCKQTHGKTIACERCLESHLGYAAVTAREFAEDPTRIFERRLTLGNLKAAEWHASALGRPDVAAWVREARHKFADGDAEAVVALLALELKTAEHTESTEKVSAPSVSSVVEEDAGGQF